jgi:hypothetical protein
MIQSALRLVAVGGLLWLTGCEGDLERMVGGDDCCCFKTQGVERFEVMSRDECAEDEYSESGRKQPDGTSDGDCVSRNHCDSASRRFRLKLGQPPGELRLAQLDSNPSACADLCQAHPELCTYLEAPEDLSLSLRRLHSKLRSAASAGRLAKLTIMRLFGQETDPCERSDLLVSDSELSNSGSEDCSLISPIGGTERDSAPATAEIVLPPQLEAVWSPWPSALQFEDPEKRPQLEVALGKDAILSGTVARVDLEASVLLIETRIEDGSRSCSGLILTLPTRGRS